MSTEETKQRVCAAFSRRLDDPTSVVASLGGYTWGAKVLVMVLLQINQTSSPNAYRLAQFHHHWGSCDLLSVWRQKV